MSPALRYIHERAETYLTCSERKRSCGEEALARFSDAIRIGKEEVCFFHNFSPGSITVGVSPNVLWGDTPSDSSPAATESL